MTKRSTAGWIGGINGATTPLCFGRTAEEAQQKLCEIASAMSIKPLTWSDLLATGRYRVVPAVRSWNSWGDDEMNLLLQWSASRVRGLREHVADRKDMPALREGTVAQSREELLAVVLNAPVNELIVRKTPDGGLVIEEPEKCQVAADTRVELASRKVLLQLEIAEKEKEIRTVEKHGNRFPDLQVLVTELRQELKELNRRYDESEQDTNKRVQRIVERWRKSDDEEQRLVATAFLRLSYGRGSLGVEEDRES